MSKKKQLGAIREDLIERIDGVRGDVSRIRWVERALEYRLETLPREGEVTEFRRLKPREPRASADLPQVTVEPSRYFGAGETGVLSSTGEVVQVGEVRPTAQQLAGKNNVTVMVARRWLESDEWRRYW
jgi:hypothetical protein